MYEKSEFGLGLSLRARHIIKSLRMATDELDLALMAPRNDLLSDREENEAYLLAEPGRQYAVYFPGGGSVNLDMSPSEGAWQYRWINLDEAVWQEYRSVQLQGLFSLTAPSAGHWIAVILPVGGP